MYLNQGLIGFLLLVKIQKIGQNNCTLQTSSYLKHFIHC